MPKAKALPPALRLADARACLAHITDKGSCRITYERSDLMAKGKQGTATPGADGTIQPQSDLKARELRIALARYIHPKDLDRAVKRLTKADSLRPLRPAAQVCGGKSILELIWEDLDATVERLQGGGEAEDGNDVGRAQGLAYAIAVIQNPYFPNIEHVRNEAMDRWEASNEE